MADIIELIGAAKSMDWAQIALNGDGSSCFHVEASGRFCGRSIRWMGHQSAKPDHLFEPLYVALTRAAKSKVTCVWSRADDDTDLWEGSCGVAWSLPDGTPAENGMNYCPRCGAKLETQQPKETQ